MPKKGDKILTKSRVEKLGLNTVSVITADMLNGYTSIGDAAFYDCRDLKSVTIGNSITSIGDYAFYKCRGLTTMVISDSVTSIGNSAFRYCRGLTSIEIPNNVTSIGNHAFEGCNSLTSVTIGNSVKSIGYMTFSDCISLTSITIPNSVMSIESSAFDDCSGLTSITIRNKTYEKQTVNNDKCKAYKGFNADMTCRDFQYEEGKTYKFKGEPKLCECGFHACLNLIDVFNYYDGTFGQDIVIHEVELEGVIDDNNYSSKVVAKKITIGKRIL